ncbi:hypothetical protein B0H10DRAFT_2023091 [Mycena sp. CBHHK59/15]|nr:hypothetical protein B0H10DRAFT_2023091 [Mycena sp. CBHHK59/15]
MCRCRRRRCRVRGSPSHGNPPGLTRHRLPSRSTARTRAITAPSRSRITSTHRTARPHSPSLRSSPGASSPPNILFIFLSLPPSLPPTIPPQSYASHDLSQFR